MSHLSQEGLQPGEIELYKTDWKIEVWKIWRSSVGKPPLRESRDRFFYIVSEDEFEEFSTRGQQQAEISYKLP